MKIITYYQVQTAAEQKGLSLSKLAKKSGVARSVLDRWRTGKSTPTLRTLEKLSEVLKQHSPQTEGKAA